MPSEVYILPPRRHLLRTLGRVLFAVAWALVASEFFLRIFAQQPLIPRNVTGSNFGIRVNTPNTRYWQRTPEVNVEVRINSQGIRADEEIALEKPAGVKRIVVLGDSYGMGYEVDLKDAFTTQMANLLNAAGQRVQIVNLSVSGYGNAEELLMLRSRGFAFHPDLVLLAWHQTDYDDNVRSELFALRDGKLVRDKAAYLPGVKARQMLDHIPGYSWVEANSQLYSFVRETVAKKAKDILASIRGGNQNSGAAVAGRSTLTPTTAPAPEPNYAERLTAALLRQIQDECEQNGARLVVLDVPTWISRTKSISQFPSIAVDAGPTRLDVVSPLPAFQAHRGEKLFWEKGHYHFTPLGCRLVAQALVQDILKRNLLAAN